jgi:hypothetical protein
MIARAEAVAAPEEEKQHLQTVYNALLELE